MTFIRYPHLEKYGNLEVQDIEFGVCHIFPKLDGTNASVWWEPDPDCDGGLKAGSRNRELSINKDNAGFLEAIKDNTNLKNYCINNRHILYGEWLVPHTIKTYREDAWRKFWIFDVYDRETEKMLPYEVYQPLLEQYKLDYIPCVKIFKNPSYDNLMHEAKNNSGFLLPDGATGEGIVIKNYSWVNKFNRQPWAKIVLNEFKDKFHAAMGPSVGENRSPALIIVENTVSQHLVDKEYAKIVLENNGEFPKAKIPQLLHSVFYSVVKEELWDQLKKINYASVNFQELKALCFNKTKELCPQLFSSATPISAIGESVNS